MNALLNLTLEFYRAARSAPVTGFLDVALGILKTHIPFRSATWSSGIADAGGEVLKFYSVHRYGAGLQPAQVGAMAAAARHAGCAVIHEPRHLSITDGGRAQWLSCRRDAADAHFTAHECELLGTLMPHLVEAWSINRALICGDDALDNAARFADDQALIDRNGNLLHCGRRFHEFLCAAWPAWAGTEIPMEMLAELLDQPASRRVKCGVSFRARGLGDAVLLTAQPAGALERLSPRELAISRHFGAGKSYKEIARDTRLAPATVRNVLQKAYRKLGIDNKVSLARMLELGTP